jgi:hypothetical protein
MGPTTLTKDESGKAKKLAENKHRPGGSNLPGDNMQPGNSFVHLKGNWKLKRSASDCICIRDLYDPDLQYAGLGILQETKVECPEVRDGKGAIIHPCNYWYKLRQVKFVEIDVYLKL